MPFGLFPLGHVPKVRPYWRAGYFSQSVSRFFQAREHLLAHSYRLQFRCDVRGGRSVPRAQQAQFHRSIHGRSATRLHERCRRIGSSSRGSCCEDSPFCAAEPTAADHRQPSSSRGAGLRDRLRGALVVRSGAGIQGTPPTSATARAPSLLGRARDETACSIPGLQLGC